MFYEKVLGRRRRGRGEEEEEKKPYLTHHTKK